MTSLITKFTSSAASAYQQVELALLTGKAGKVAKAAKATFMSLPTIYSTVRENASKIARTTVTALWQGGLTDGAWVIGQLPSPWGYLPYATAASSLAYLGLTAGSQYDPFAYIIDHFDDPPMQILTSLVNGSVFPSHTPAQFFLSSGTSLIGSTLVFKLTPIPFRLRVLESVIRKVNCKAILSYGGICLLGGAPGATVGCLLLEGISSLWASSLLTDFKPIFNDNYALLEAQLEAQLLVKHIEKGGKKFTTITYIVRQYLDLEPSDPTVEQQHERVAALYDRTATAAATDTSHKKTD